MVSRRETGERDTFETQLELAFSYLDMRGSRV
jgi:hypothetical protein